MLRAGSCVSVAQQCQGYDGLSLVVECAFRECPCFAILITNARGSPLLTYRIISCRPYPRFEIQGISPVLGVLGWLCSDVPTPKSVAWRALRLVIIIKRRPGWLAKKAQKERGREALVVQEGCEDK